MSGEQLALLALAVLVASWMVGAYNRLVALRSAIGLAWQHLAEGLQRRAEATAASNKRRSSASGAPLMRRRRARAWPSGAAPSPWPKGHGPGC